MQQSQVEAKLVDDYWMLTLRLPNDRLAAALKKVPSKTLLTNYVLAHVNVSSPTDNTRLWGKEISQVIAPDDHEYWQVDIKFLPPKGVNINLIDIDYQVISEKIITHKVVFWLMPDATGNTASKEPKRLSTLRGNRTNISIKWW